MFIYMNKKGTFDKVIQLVSYLINTVKLYTAVVTQLQNTRSVVIYLRKLTYTALEF